MNRLEYKPIVILKLFLQVTHSSKTFSESSNSLAKEQVSEIESILETPRKAALKKCIRKILIQKQKLVNQNRNLNKQNKRLKK